MRELAGHDCDRMLVVKRWPLRDALLAYLAKMREAARKAYERDVLLYYIRRPHLKKGSDLKFPTKPKILKGE